MNSRNRAPVSFLIGSCLALLVLPVLACSDANTSDDGVTNTENTGGAASAGGSTNSGGTDGDLSSAGGASTSGGAPSSDTGGAANTGGADGSGGLSASGGSDTGGSPGSGGDGSGGAVVCAGNAVSLSANGTGTENDGAHARVMIDLMTDLPIGNEERTVEFWAYIRSTDWVGETNTIFEYGDQSKTAAGFGLDFGGVTGSIDPYTNGGFDNDNQATGLPTDVDQWVHFAMTWDGTAVLTYVNGELKSTKAGGGTTMLQTADTQFTFGCNNPRFSCFGGYLDELRVWTVARSGSEIMGSYDQGLAGDEAGLVAYLKFNEESGTIVTDSVTSAGHTAHDGTLTAVGADQVPTLVPSTVPITCQ